MNAKKERKDEEFYDGFKRTIEKELKKAKEEKLNEWTKIRNEVSGIQNLIVEREAILKDEIGLFYDERIRNLQKLLTESIFLEKLPIPNESEIGSIVVGSYDKMKKDLLKVLKEKTNGKAEFLASKLNDKVTIGHIILPGKEKFLKREIETNVSLFNSIYCSDYSILVHTYNSQTKRNEMKNLESNETTTVDKNSFIFPENDLIYESRTEIFHQDINTISIKILEKYLFIRKSAILLIIDYIKAKGNYAYWIEENNENDIYGPNVTNFYSLEKTIIETIDFNDFLKEAFQENIELLFSKTKIFLVNIENQNIQVYLQENLLGREERIVGSRKIETNELAFVFQNVQDSSKNLIIKYFSL